VWWTTRLRHRHRQPEIMDEPGLDPGRHVLALQGLERINRWSGSSRIIWPAVRDLAREKRRPLRLLDVATGAGDLPVALWRKARRAGLSLAVEGCDRSPQALAYARQRAEARGAAVRFFPWDALAGPCPDGYDVIISSLFLHHLDEEQAVRLLSNMAASAGSMVMVNDLRRSAAGFVLAYIGTRLLSRSDVVHVDGPRSVEAAFTPEEARRLAERAGLAGATVTRRWPCRFLLRWRRP
jgi:2-polyprenyl-3-methyl-5-hydroxy-6-metoxy-1,4-benzoquinol methylase